MATQEFAFIPRKLTRSAGVAKDASRSRTTLNRQEEIRNEHIVSKSTSDTKQKGDKYLDGRDYTALFELALSEHALWSNVELLEILDAKEDGFVSISYLVQASPVFAGLISVPPESTLIRCVRSSSILEGRILISELPSGEWFKRNDSDTKFEGGYEVRREDWTKVRERVRKYTSFHWDGKTIYVENLPYHARTYCAVYQFVQQLLADELDADSNTLAIQSISFPPHQKDDPSSPPPAVGKGFAFIILSRTKDVEYLLERWPWNLDERSTHRMEVSKVVLEAADLGFRCLSKRSWDRLKEEYLTLQRRILEKTMTANVPGPSAPKPERFDAVSVPTPQNQGRMDVSVAEQSGTPPDCFPADCLIFVRNVHPETNKTTLRVLFASAFNRDTSAIDYVDYNKGLDSCYLRLSEPQHARSLVSYFSAHKTTQTSGLDNVGAPATESESIQAKLVQGKKEEVYWEKVPEKVRKAAVSRAQGESESETAHVREQNDGAGGRKRKRRNP